ncbi:MAG: hypothetical protein M0D55_09480 [Elusimicrobiota bacterium]|nr:MAG: hypothetical protein M0D55_09480 [Elusimicrobiota bacterium]
MLMASGRDSEYVNGYAQAVGLDQPRPAKVALELVGTEARKCHVIYAPDEDGINRPICLHLVRAKKQNRIRQSGFFVSVWMADLKKS